MITRGLSYFLFFMFSLSSCLAQSNLQSKDKESAYLKIINQRAEKIVSTLGVTDSLKAASVKDIIAGRYSELNNIQTGRDERIKALKAANISDKEVLNAQIKACKDSADASIEKSHDKYISALSKLLTAQQVDQVKDGMTYNVLPITYKGYLAMIPELTDKQKQQIKIWLTEAREHAMDAESSEKKHGWFGKYKGRINNYLSAQGYDLKQASENWANKVNEEKKAKEDSNKKN